MASTFLGTREAEFTNIPFQKDKLYVSAISLYAHSYGWSGSNEVKFAYNGPGDLTIFSLFPTYIPEYEIDAMIYDHDFDQGSLQGIWIDNGVWNLISDDTNNLSFCNEDADYFTNFHFGSQDWTNYAIELAVQPKAYKEEAYTSLNVRHNLETSSGYSGTLGFPNLYYDFLSFPPYNTYSQGFFQESSEPWFTLKMEVFDFQIKYFINGRQLGEAFNDQYSNGFIKFYSSPHLQVCVDNIHVWKENRKCAAGGSGEWEIINL